MSTVDKVQPEGRRMLRIEVKNSETPIERKPEWIRTTAKAGKEYKDMRSLSMGRGLHTVCAEAGCPNIYECWEDREATFLIGGAFCTRRCDFCDIATGKPREYDKDEPNRVSDSVAELGLKYATVTGVARDDLPDGAAWLFAETCRQIHEKCPGTGVELLVDDMKAHPAALDTVFASQPEVFGHNLETVPRIFKKIRPAFRYERSLDVLNAANEAGLITKSNLILGMGETREEIEDAMFDLVESGTHLLTLTQYLRPSPRHHPIDRWVHPEEFISLSKIAKEMGFLGVMAGPMVRSSYRAGRLWGQAMRELGREIPESLAHLADEGTTRQEASSLLSQLPHLRGGQSIPVASAAGNGTEAGTASGGPACASMKTMAQATAATTGTRNTAATHTESETATPDTHSNNGVRQLPIVSQGSGGGCCGSRNAGASAGCGCA